MTAWQKIRRRSERPPQFSGDWAGRSEVRSVAPRAVARGPGSCRRNAVEPLPGKPHRLAGLEQKPEDADESGENGCLLMTDLRKHGFPSPW
jgi:hypothetical protein